MSEIKYLDRPIVKVRLTEAPMYGMNLDGYTSKMGAPTSWLVKIEGDTRWRRVMMLCFSNAASYFLRIGGEMVYLITSQIPSSNLD